MAAVTLAFGAFGAVAGAAPADIRPAASSSTVDNPYSPAYQHPYRHGVLPTRDQLGKMRSWDAAHRNAPAATGPETLSYGGGVDGVGVQSGGKNKVYLVFYGNQWGTQGTNSAGDATLVRRPPTTSRCLPTRPR